MNFLYSKQTPIQSSYYSYCLEKGKGNKIFDFIEGNLNHYFANYTALREIYKKLHPFQFIKEGDVVFTVGFHNQFMGLGVSHPLIYSELVGNKGHVYAIDPDPINIESIKSYIKEQNISNITPIHGGIWDKKDTIDFVFFKDYTSSNMPKKLLDKHFDNLKNRWGDRITKESYEVSVSVDTLDSILPSLPHKVTHINLTTNGAENEGVLGVKDMMNSSKPSISFPLRKLELPMYQLLEEKGYNIYIANAPHKPWETGNFFFAIALHKDKLQEIPFLEGFKKLSQEELYSENGPFNNYI